MASAAHTKVTPPALRDYRRQGRKIVMITACDAITARLADEAGVDVMLVGDHAASVLLGYDTTHAVTVEDMLTLTRAASRRANRAMLIADLPFGSFERDDGQGVDTAIRLVKEGFADGVKLEPGIIAASRAKAITAAGVPVMAHLGLSSQQVMEGNFSPAADTLESARGLLEEARRFEAAGVFAVLLEALPAELAEAVTNGISVPTIGVGSGPGCSGQILSIHDVIGLDPGHNPPWVKRYGTANDAALAAIRSYGEDVREARFPASEHAFALPPDAALALESLPAAT